MTTPTQAQEQKRTTWTVAALCRAIDNPGSTPDDIKAAQRWNAITPGSARDWLKGYNAGLRANGAPPVTIDRTN